MPTDRVVARSVGERFAIPHTFQPQLGVIQALVGIGGALLRIFLGSLLFAVWGTYSLVAWSAIGNRFSRVAALVALSFLFLLSFTVLMLAISALARKFPCERPEAREMPDASGI